MKIDFESIKEQLQDKLVDFLQRNNIDIKSNGSWRFKCIVPGHSDSKPSANIIPGSQGREWYCHACQIHGDIFTAAHYLLGKPLDSTGFIEENVTYLGELYGVDIPKQDLSENDVKIWRARMAYRLVAQHMQDCKYTQPFLDHIADRGWSPDYIKLLGIGQITNLNKLQEKLMAQGFEPSLLEEISLTGPNAEWIFAKDKIVFTLYDEKGRPCGFAARDLNYSETSEGPKYKNTASNLLYNKKRVLYNIHEAKKHKDKKLYIFEGYADVITARLLAAMDNCVALGGVALSEEHINIIRQSELNDIVVCLDGDTTGRKKAAEIVEKLSGQPGLNLYVLTLPDDKTLKDADAFIKNAGIDRWKDACKAAISAFEWQLEQDLSSEDNEQKIKKAVQIILNEQSPLKVFKMADVLSKQTNVPVEVIRQQIEYERDRDAARMENAIIQQARNISSKLSNDPGNAYNILTMGQLQLESMLSRKYYDLTSSDIQFQRFAEMHKKNLDASHQTGIMTGWPVFNEKTLGIPPEDTVIYIGGKPNVGKSSLMAQLTLDVITSNRDTIVCIYTIDDSADKFSARMVSYIKSIPTAWVTKTKYMDAKMPGSNVIEIVESGYNKLKEYIKDGRLYFFEKKDGNTWADADRWLAKLRKQYPNAKIIMMLDNFHLLRDYSGTDDTARYSTLSKDIAQSVNKHGVVLMSTVEYHKLRDGVRPENESIHHTNQLSYDAHLIIHMINYEQEFKARTPLSWDSSEDFEYNYDENYPKRVAKKKPVVEMSFGKSKLEEFKGSIFFNFDPARSRFHEVSSHEQSKYLEASIKAPWMAKR